ncbi:hypothetical protein [Streptomyces brevispora]|uniref:hypothetical protein n=1 Tax=Streptomyces brevispora TaxID=887462 RepID=UPI003805B785
MLETIPPDEIEDGWPHYGRPRMRLTSGARLSNLRWHFYDSAMARIAKGRPVRVATYVPATPGTDPAAVHARLAKVADDREWRVHRITYTDCPGKDPTTAPYSDEGRPALDRACGAARGGFVDGILTTGRQAIPASDDVYEQYLRWLHDRCAFVAFPSSWFQWPALLPTYSISTPKGTTR